MNSLDVQDLIDLIAAYSPSNPIEENTAAVWGTALADIPNDVATDAVHEHFMAGCGPWINIGDIRRRVADRMGLLPPDAETAYAQAVEFRRWLDNRAGAEPPIHPAALACARTIGWLTFSEDDRVAHTRFVAGYSPARERAMRELATTPFPQLAAKLAAPKALPGGWGVRPPADPPADPAGQIAVRRTLSSLTNAWASGDSDV